MWRASMSYSDKIVQLIKENKIETAVELLLEAVELEPDNPLHLVNLGNLLLQHKEYEQAESFFLRALQLDEHMATAHFGLASLHYELGKYKDAASAFRACIALNMEDAEVYYLLGMSYLKLKNPLLASPFLQRASELEEGVDYLFQYGLTLAQLDHLTEAKKVFKRVLAIDEKHADSLYNLAIIYIHEDRYDETVDLLQATLAINPNHQLAKRALEQFER